MTIKEETVGVKDIVDGGNITVDDTDPKNPILSVDSIDDAPIGATTPSTGVFTDLEATGDVDFSGANSVSFLSGTWTPTIIGETSAGTNTYAAQTGKYQRVGNRITCGLDIAVSGANSGTGNIVVEGLPFTSSGDDSGFSPNVNNLTLPANAYQLTGICNGTKVLLKWNISGGASIRVVAADVGSNFRITASFSYDVA